MTSDPSPDPIPAEARAILRRIADELRHTPGPIIADPSEVAQLINRTARRIEGVAATGRPARPRAWRLPNAVPGCASLPAVDMVTAADGREIAIERRRRRVGKM